MIIISTPSGHVLMFDKTSEIQEMANMLTNLHETAEAGHLDNPPYMLIIATKDAEEGMTYLDQYTDWLKQRLSHDDGYNQ